MTETLLQQLFGLDLNPAEERLILSIHKSNQVQLLDVFSEDLKQKYLHALSEIRILPDDWVQASSG